MHRQRRLQCLVGNGLRVVVYMSHELSGHKKRIILLCSAFALAGALLVVCPGQSLRQPAGPAGASGAAEASQLQAYKIGGTAPALGDDPNARTGFDFDSDSGIYSTLVRAILFVVVLGVAAFYVSKKLVPRITNLPGKEVRVIETVYLGPRKAVHVLEVGGRRLLVASTNENITKLADITGDLTDLSVQQAGYN